MLSADGSKFNTCAICFGKDGQGISTTASGAPKVE